MNSFFRLLLVTAAALLAAREARALEISALYFASCQRHLGVILGVDAQNIRIATIGGEVVTLPRYQIIYWSSYPVEDLPLPLSASMLWEPRLKIYTRQDYRKVLLAEGWPIDFTDDRISFLTPEGVKQVIEIDSIWEIESVETPFSLTDKVMSQLRSLSFAHPPVFRDCPNLQKGQKIAYPEQTLTDPISISTSSTVSSRATSGSKNSRPASISTPCHSYTVTTPTLACGKHLARATAPMTEGRTTTRPF